MILPQFTRPEKTPKALRPPAQGWSHDRRPTLGPTQQHPSARTKNSPHPRPSRPSRPSRPPDLPTFRPSDLPTFRPSDLPTFRLHVATRRFNRSPRFQSWVDAPHKNKSHPGRVFFIPAGISACSRWFVRNERHHRIQVPKVNASRQGFLHPGRDLSL
jgi:hypothetical protein